MAVALRFRLLRGNEDPIAFDVQGEFKLALEPVYSSDQVDADTPAKPVEIRYRWEITGAAVVTQTSTVAGGLQRFLAFLASLTAGGDEAVSGFELLRVEGAPDGSETEEADLTVGAPTWYDIRLENVETDEPLAAEAAGHMKTNFPLRMRISAAKQAEGANTDLTNVLTLTQRVKVESIDSLRTLSWETDVTTKPGTDARVPLATYGVIPISGVGTRWAYSTNDDSGLDIESEGGRELPAPARVPTRARGISRVQEFGVTIGATGPGTSPSSVSLVEEETETPDGIVRTVSANAKGPQAERWVMAWKPAAVKEQSVSRDKSGRGFSATWTLRAPAQRPTLDVQVDLEGGGQAIAFRPLSRGLPPMRFDGPLLPWTAVVSLRVTRYGGTGTRAELPFPALLPSPWVLMLPESKEGSPFELERAVDPASTRWAREARLVYRADQLVPTASGTTPKPPGAGAAGFPDPAEYLRRNPGKTETYGA